MRILEAGPKEGFGAMQVRFLAKQQSKNIKARVQLLIRQKHPLVQAEHIVMSSKGENLLL